MVHGKVRVVWKSYMMASGAQCVTTILELRRHWWYAEPLATTTGKPRAMVPMGAVCFELGVIYYKDMNYNHISQVCETKKKKKKQKNKKQNKNKTKTKQTKTHTQNKKQNKNKTKPENKQTNKTKTNKQ